MPIKFGLTHKNRSLFSNFASAMEEEDDSGSEFEDWEILHEFDDTFPQNYSSNFPDSNPSLFEGDSCFGSTILSDYFSLPKHQPNANEPYSIDTNSENLNCRKSTTELGSQSADELINQSHDQNNLTDITKTLTEITTDFKKLEREAGDDGVARDEPLFAKEDMYSPPMESEEYAEESERQDELFDHHSSSNNSSTGNELVVLKSGDDAGKETSDTGGDHIESVNDSNKDSMESRIAEVKSKVIKCGEVEAAPRRRRDVWWKVPFQVRRYFYLRATPPWYFSLAFSFVGMVILGRTFYKTKIRKSKIRQSKISVDDSKKVLQFPDRAARLNEAFSVMRMRQVPVLRASLTAANSRSWPVMTMR